MSIAATAAPDFDRTRSSSGSWCTLAQAARILDVSTDSLKSIALANKVRTRAIAGARIQFSVEDLRQLAAEGTT